ncbi:hypothetical protein BpHYR1_011934, partial [Brachionus plicatilis]
MCISFLIWSRFLSKISNEFDLCMEKSTDFFLRKLGSLTLAIIWSFSCVNFSNTLASNLENWLSLANLAQNGAGHFGPSDQACHSDRHNLRLFLSKSNLVPLDVQTIGFVDCMVTTLNTDKFAWLILYLLVSDSKHKIFTYLYFWDYKIYLSTTVFDQRKAYFVYSKLCLMENSLTGLDLRLSLLNLLNILLVGLRLKTINNKIKLNSLLNYVIFKQK